MKWFYELIYGRFRAPWDIGPRVELVQLVESGRLQPCRALDLGSGTASNCIFLAQQGFDVTGIDFASAAIELGRKRAKQAGVNVNFVVDDLTNLQNVSGTFDLLVDYGTLDDLKPAQRDLYIKNIFPLTHAGTRYLFFAFEWQTRWYERLYFDSMALQIGEAQCRFAPYFEIEKIAGHVDYRQFPAGEATYWMTRKDGAVEGY